MRTKGNGAILLATENRAKQERLAWLLKDLELRWVTPDQVPLAAPQVEEAGDSHQAIATAKAAAWSLPYGGMVIASDGGLVVPALGRRWDSLHTRRSSSIDDLSRARRLQALMANLEHEERLAYWVEAVVIAKAGRALHALSAQSGQGYIARDVRSDLIRNGFWVGALWYFPQMGKLYGEMTPAELQRVGDHWTTLKEQIRKLPPLLGERASSRQLSP